MEKAKPTDDRRRIQLTVSDELDDILNRLSLRFGQPKSKIITDALNGSIPTLKKVADMADKLEGMKDGIKKGFFDFFGGGHGTD
jgi:predicted DNA-binding protein